MTPVAKLDKGIVNFGQLNGIIAAPILGISYAVQRWLNPCQSTTFAWNILVECSSERQSEAGWELKSLIFLSGINLFSFWVAIYLIGAFIFQGAELHFVPCYCLVSYIKNLRISLENCGKCNIERGLGRYRQLQILEGFFNWIHQDIVTPSTLNILIITTIISTYAMISMGTQLSIPHVILFSCVLVNSLACIVLMIGAFALVHVESTRMFRYIKEKLIPNLETNCSSYSERCKVKVIKKLVASLYILKVRIGSVNFVEKTTPIAILDFCLAQIVSLLLMG
ncbi:unnamed protein product [Orchesella dallaii]|uniref:Gustatory receptor n=1 Tax=Orchesella dallaii TaxID=48710 RepID=A0ABP1R7G6_9HEXA